MNRLNLLSCIPVFACVAAVSPSACAQEARSFDIAAGPLGGALNAYAVQSDQQILFTSALVAGLRTNGLRGRYAPRDALDRLLAGSGLAWSESRPGVIVLRRLEVAEEALTELDDVVVTGTLLRSSGDIASPVIRLDRDALDRRGFGTVAEVLVDIPQNYAGSATPIVQATASDTGASNNVYATGVNLRGLGPASTLTLVNGRRLAGTGSRAEFADISALPSAAVERVDVLLDGASALYTAFSALDPLTADKVSRLTGMVTETRTSRSTGAGFSGAKSSVSRSQTERPLLEPGEVRALPDDEQLVFVTGRKPLRTAKLKYDRRRPFRERARIGAPDQAVRLDGPPRRPHAWAGVVARGEDSGAQRPLFKAVGAEMEDQGPDTSAAQALTDAARQMEALKAVMNRLRGDDR